MLINTISFRTIENTNFISSKNNNLIKRFRSFRGKSSSNEKEFFCIEGTHLLEELINAKITPEKVIATKEWLLINNSLIDGLNQELIFTVTKEVLRSCLTTKNPDGVAALVKLSSIKNFRICKEDNFILVLDRIQDPGNLGNLFRTALAAGINKVLLGGGANPLSQKVLRASCGSIFHLPFLRIEGDTEKVVSDLLINLEKVQKLILIWLTFIVNARIITKINFYCESSFKYF